MASSDIKPDIDKDPHKDQEVDLNCASRGMWLVKVPKYLADVWRSSPSPHVGKLKTVSSSIPGAKPDVVFTLDATIGSQAQPIARTEHKFVLSKTDKAAQHLIVISQGTTPHLDFTAGSLAVEGNVIQRAECRPPADATYFEAKRAKVEEAKKDVKTVIQLENTVQAYKPTTKREIDVENDLRRKAAAPKARSERDDVVEMLLKAFQKHQYYNIKDLAKITGQPLTFLKEILQEYCQYNMKPPHRNMWELKPEYRHYDELELHIPKSNKICSHNCGIVAQQVEGYKINVALLVDFIKGKMFGAKSVPKTLTKVPLCKFLNAKSFRTRPYFQITAQEALKRFDSKDQQEYQRHWGLERIVEWNLAAILPAALYFQTPGIQQLATCLLVIHGHQGLEAIVVDYAEYKSKWIYRTSLALIYLISITSLAGLTYFNYSNVGLFGAIKQLWSLKGSKTDSK